METQVGIMVTGNTPSGGISGYDLPDHSPEATLPAATTPAQTKQTFTELYLSSYAEMILLARVLVGPSSSTEDLVQDAFVALHRKWGSVRQPRAYLRRSVVNACRSHHRRAYRETQHLATTLIPSQLRIEGTAPTLEDTANDAHLLDQALQDLTARQRAAVVLRYYADLSDADIAAALRCRTGTVASLIHRGLEKLRTSLEFDTSNQHLPEDQQLPPHPYDRGN